MIYLFDVDGTLTPAKSKIDKGFARDFYNWQKGKQVYIVSGGSFPRIVDQLGRKITDDICRAPAGALQISLKDRSSL